MTRKLQMTQTCTVTRNPVTGESGDTAVASNLPCTPPSPAGKSTRELPGMATIVALFEIRTEATVTIEDNDVLATGGRTFSILRAQRWEPSGAAKQPFYFLVLEEMAT